MALRPFLASLFLRGLFCLARFGVFRPISALRAAYGGCAPKRACGRSAMGDQRRCLWNPSPDGATPLRVLRTWAAPNMGYAQPLKRLDLNFRPFVTQWLSWVLPGVLTAFCPKRKIASYNLARGVTTFRLLQHPTPGTTHAPAQPLGAERRGGSACGR